MTVLHVSSALLPSGWADNARIIVRDGRISSVERGAAAQLNDARHTIAVPGIASLHRNAFQRGMAGLAEMRSPTAFAASGAAAGLCPVMEASLGDGVFPARDIPGQGGRFGTGTASNILVGVADELRQPDYCHRLHYRERNVLALTGGSSTGRSLFDGALAGGTQALGQTAAGLHTGAAADIVTLNVEHSSLGRRKGDVIPESWIFAAGHGAVDCVYARGVKVVENGRHHSRQRACKDFSAVVRRLAA